MLTKKIHTSIFPIFCIFGWFLWWHLPQESIRLEHVPAAYMPWYVCSSGRTSTARGVSVFSIWKVNSVASVVVRHGSYCSHDPVRKGGFDEAASQKQSCCDDRYGRLNYFWRSFQNDMSYHTEILYQPLGNTCDLPTYLSPPLFVRWWPWGNLYENWKLLPSLGTREFLRQKNLSYSLGRAKNSPYQRYFVPVSYHFTMKPPCFYDTNKKPLKRAF